jgi:HK97 family phage major capsid protein
MPYNSLVGRTDIDSMVPAPVSQDVLKQIVETNPLFSLAKRLPDMSSYTYTMPVMSALALGYFVSGDTGLKQTTEVNWEDKYVTAEEVAVIVPIPESVLNDSGFDIWAQVKPELIAAFNTTIARAVFYGTNIPASWTTNLGAAGILAGSTAAGHTLSLAAYADAYEAILGETAAGVDGIFMSVEADGFAVNGNIAHQSVRGILRNTRDSNGNPIFSKDGAGYLLDGSPIYFPLDGSVVAGSSLMISGQWDQLVYSIRQDMSYKILDQAVIQDAGGNIVYNLAQQDMVALRAVMRLGFALPNPINRVNETAATRFPFAVLTA